MPTFQELLPMRLVAEQPLTYESVSKPVQMGNKNRIAYGGFNLALSIQAAFHSLSVKSEEELATWAIYTATGLFLGPTSLDAPVQFIVTKLRDTRSFVSRFIIARQNINGKSRDCFCATIDFSRKVPSSVGRPNLNKAAPLCYSLPPTRSYPPPEDLPDTYDMFAEKVKQGKLSDKMLQAFAGTFGALQDVAQPKTIKGDIFDESIFGLVAVKDTEYMKAVPDPTLRRTADYFRTKHSLRPASGSNKDSNILPLSYHANRASFIGFVLDGALAFLPLPEHGLSLMDSGACSSLDFALRFHDDDIDCDDFLLREMRTYCGDRERTFSESLVWDRQGRMVASMSQQSILRPLPPPKESGTQQSAKL